MRPPIILRRDQRKELHKRVVAQYEKILPKHKYKAGNKSIDEFDVAECTVCMDNFSNGVVIRKLPICKHIFHDDCIMKWLAMD